MTAPFFHGTVAELAVGDLLVAGRASNYRPEVTMNHVYFTSRVEGGGLAAEIAVILAEQAGRSGVSPRVYEVEPTGAFEDDPNVTDKKFPGNPTLSYRSRDPLRVVAEVTDWPRLDDAEREAWRARLRTLLTDPDAEIIN